MDNKLYTTEQLVDRFEARRRIQNIMGIFSQHYLLKMEKDIFSDLWSGGEDVCLGVNAGYYVGRAAVGGYYEALHRRNVLTNQTLRAIFPEKVEGKTEEETYGIGFMNYFPLDTPVVEIAADGQTAKGIWALRNTYSQVSAGGPEAFWQWGYITVDFRKENDDWKIWHLNLLNDVHVRAGQKLHETYTPYPELPEFSPLKEFVMPEPAVQTEVRPLYTPDRPFTEPPRLPEPYDTFDHTFSYGYAERSDA